MTEGYIKFGCEWIPEPIDIPDAAFSALTAARSDLRERGLLGAHPDGMGFGNISIRAGKRGFLITGSATGGLPELAPHHYALVEDYRFLENWLRSRGETKASSESLTHAAVYEALPSAGAVIHVHSARIWKEGLDRLPTTDSSIEYGTPEIAMAVTDLARDPVTRRARTVIMGGHQDGVICFGTSLDQARATVLALLSG